MNKNIILFHGDLDGLYSAMLFYKTNKNEIEIEEVRSIDYGHDHSTLKNQYDGFFVFDFSENPGEERTVLWVDHHLEQVASENKAAFTLFEESPSCVGLMAKNKMFDASLISAEYLDCINSVDSASYKWSDDFTQEDLVFPDVNKNLLNKLVALNQILRKNRKSGLAEKLFASEMLSVDKLIVLADRDKGPKTVKYQDIIDARLTLFNKIMADTEKYIKYFSGVPILFTKDFSSKDWKGYDLNLFSYLTNKSPYVLVAFDFSSGFNIQIAKNVFFDKEVPSLYDTIKGEIEEARGHDGIINISFANRDLAFEKIDKIIGLLSKHI